MGEVVEMSKGKKIKIKRKHVEWITQMLGQNMNGVKCKITDVRLIDKACDFLEPYGVKKVAPPALRQLSEGEKHTEEEVKANNEAQKAHQEEMKATRDEAVEFDMPDSYCLLVAERLRKMEDFVASPSHRKDVIMMADAFGVE